MIVRIPARDPDEDGGREQKHGEEARQRKHGIPLCKFAHGNIGRRLRQHGPQEEAAEGAGPEDDEELDRQPSIHVAPTLEQEGRDQPADPVHSSAA